MWGQNNWNSPPREMICGHGQEQKFEYPYPWDSKIIPMAYPQAKVIDQNPTLCPASPCQLDIDMHIILSTPKLEFQDSNTGRDWSMV